MRNAMITTRRLGIGRLGIAAVMALSVGMAACGKKPVIVEEKKGARAVRVSTVEQRPMAGGLSASGLLISREEAAVNPELSGYRVAKVYVEVDARVREGQPLAQLDDTLLKSQIAQQTALVAQQQVAADQAASQAHDVEGLDSQGVLSNIVPPAIKAHPRPPSYAICRPATLG